MSADDASTRGAVDTAAATEVAAGGLGSMASLLGEMAATRAPALLPGTLVAGQYRIERAVGAERKAARRIIDLRRRHAEV